MEPLIQTYGRVAGIVFVYMALWFLLAVIKKRNDVADVAWGLGFLLVALVTQGTRDTFHGRGLLITALVALWASRLAIHIHLRNKGKGEDYRYKAWREQWGQWFYLRTFLQVFMLQGLFMLVIAAPIVIVNTNRAVPLGWLDIVGISIWLVGFFFESVGDWQLARFTRDPKNRGQILQSGLWQYSRHPNYFGEVTLWWGLWLISHSAPCGWAGIIGPITITFLILKVSGIPMLEEKAILNPAFQEYAKRVSVFFPLPPRR